MGAIAGMICFYNEIVDVAIDGVAQERPASVFTTKANRPGSEPPGDIA